VAHQGSSSRVLYPANIARIERTVHVRQDVLHLDLSFLESLPADRTHVGVVAAVNRHVFPQIALVEERVPAGRADVGVRIGGVSRGLVPSHVSLQGSRSGDSSLADTALVAGL